jgi:hypothetical protein
MTTKPNPVRNATCRNSAHSKQRARQTDGTGLLLGEHCSRPPAPRRRLLPRRLVAARNAIASAYPPPVACWARSRGGGSSAAKVPFRSGFVHLFSSRMLSFVKSRSGTMANSVTRSMARSPERRSLTALTRHSDFVSSAEGLVVPATMSTPVKLPLVPGLVAQSPPVRPDGKARPSGTLLTHPAILPARQPGGWPSGADAELQERLRADGEPAVCDGLRGCTCPRPRWDNAPGPGAGAEQAPRLAGERQEGIAFSGARRPAGGLGIGWG